MVLLFPHAAVIRYTRQGRFQPLIIIMHMEDERGRGKCVGDKRSRKEVALSLVMKLPGEFAHLSLTL